MIFVQAIIEAKNKQLDLRDIYAWFLANFAHFRTCNLTWKVKTKRFQPKTAAVAS